LIRAIRQMRGTARYWTLIMLVYVVEDVVLAAMVAGPWRSFKLIAGVVFVLLTLASGTIAVAKFRDERASRE